MRHADRLWRRRSDHGSERGAAAVSGGDQLETRHDRRVGTSAAQREGGRSARREDGENQCNHEDTKLHEDHEKNNRFSSSCVFVFFVVLADVVALAVLSRRTEETSLCLNPFPSVHAVICAWQLLGATSIGSRAVPSTRHKPPTAWRETASNRP